MREELRNKLNGNRERLVHELLIDVGFLAKLVSTGSIDSENKSKIEAVLSDAEKVDKLLSILERSPDDCYYKFCECLENKNWDLYELLREEPVSSDLDLLSEIQAAIKAGMGVIESVEGLYERAISVYGKSTGSQVQRRFTGATEFKQRFRSLELAIINGSSKQLKFSKEYFDSGKWFVPPAPLNLAPGEASIVYVASRETDLLGGVTGGLDYLIEGTDDLHLYIAFSNPVLDSYKNFIHVEKDKSAEWACNNSEDDSIKQLKSHGFIVRCMKSKPRKCSFEMFEYTIMDA